MCGYGLEVWKKNDLTFLFRKVVFTSVQQIFISQFFLGGISMSLDTGAAVSKQKINDIKDRLLALKEHL
jgi:hypothetical protein